MQDGRLKLQFGQRTLLIRATTVRSAISDGLAVLKSGHMELAPEGIDCLRRMQFPDMGHIAQHGDIRPVSGVQQPSEFPAVRNEAESPLRRLFIRKDKFGRSWLDDIQYEAGERLRRDFERGQLQPSITANWQAIASGRDHTGKCRQSELGDFAIDSRKKVAEAISALDGDLANVALDICCFLKGLEQVERECQWPPRSAKLMLRTALSCLARHYGLGTQGKSQSGGILHWGDGSHRPSIRGSQQ
jgi:hypothetical protein